MHAQTYFYIDFFLYLHFQIVHAMVENFAANLQILFNRNHFASFISCIFVFAKAGKLCAKFDRRWQKCAKICSKSGIAVATIGIHTASIQAGCCLLRYVPNNFGSMSYYLLRFFLPMCPICCRFTWMQQNWQVCLILHGCDNITTSANRYFYSFIP